MELLISWSGVSIGADRSRSIHSVICSEPFIYIFFPVGHNFQMMSVFGLILYFLSSLPLDVLRETTQSKRSVLPFIGFFSYS